MTGILSQGEDDVGEFYYQAIMKGWSYRGVIGTFEYGGDGPNMPCLFKPLESAHLTMMDYMSQANPLHLVKAGSGVA
eukprot:12938364-Prorocentrum_lima.AAC.1